MRQRITYANVMSTIAVVIAVSTGGAYASSLMTGSGIQNGSITGIDIQNNSLSSSDIQNSSITSTDVRNGTLTAKDIVNSTITSADIKNGTLLASDFASGQLLQGPTGPAGSIGERGQTGAPGAPGAVSAYPGFTAFGGACSDAVNATLYVRCRVVPEGSYQAVFSMTPGATNNVSVTCQLKGDAVWATATVPSGQPITLVGAGPVSQTDVYVSCTSSGALNDEAWPNPQLLVTPVQAVVTP